VRAINAVLDVVGDAVRHRESKGRDSEESGESVVNGILREGFCVSPESLNRAARLNEDLKDSQKEKVPMGVCVGNSDPNEKSGSRVVFHTPDHEELQGAFDVFSRLVKSITVPIWMSTVCRSTRDGYTPKDIQQIVEKQVVDAIDGQVEYDPDLYMGPTRTGTKHLKQH